MVSKQVIVDGLLTNYCVLGEGAVVLMLHGWGDNSKTFSKIQEELSNSFMTIAVDLPGFGGSQSPKEPWTLNDYANFMASFIAKINLDIFAIIGHSNGGAIAIRGVSRGNITPKKLVLLASSGVRDQYKGKNKALRIMAKAGKVAVAPLPKSAKNKIKRKAYNSIGSDLFVAEHLQETFKNVVTDDVQEDAKNIEVPTILVYGTKDMATPPKYGELLASNMTNSELRLIENSGHFVHHDAADEVNRLIKLFLGVDK